MTMLRTGDQMPDFSFDTPFEKGLRLSEVVKEVPGRTAVVFLRYYGCTLCQYDIHLFKEGYDSIRGKDGQLLVVLQSDPEKLAAQIDKDSLPFRIACDPEQELYKLLDIKAAASMEDMLGPEAKEKIGKARGMGFVHGEYEGEELQLPAAFILDRDMKLHLVHYGKVVEDVLAADELAANM